MSICGTGGKCASNPHCRNQDCNENKIIETLPHIRGSFPKTELLRNNAHHKTRTTLANLFRAKNLEEYEAFGDGVANSKPKGGPRSGRPKKRTRPLILNPTIRWETNDERENVQRT